MTHTRSIIIAGNWKMNYGPKRAASFVQELVPQLVHLLHQHQHIINVLCPPTISLSAVHSMLAAHAHPRLALGAQNMYFEEQGAYTGETSPLMVHELCSYVILGHSERRAYFGESDELVNKKTLAALKHSLRPIVCVGENLQQYEAGQTEQVIRTQIAGSLADLPEEKVNELVIAYEPVWAIGTGKAATAEIAANVIDLIRQLYSSMYGNGAADMVHILYGGSVTASNIAEFVALPDIDGALVGGASLKLDFVELTRKAAEIAQSK